MASFMNSSKHKKRKKYQSNKNCRENKKFGNTTKLLNSFYGSSITLISKFDKNINKKPRDQSFA